MRSIDQLKIDRIHKAALDLVYTEGFDNISLRQVAQIAKVSSGTPYVYYKDKQDLLTQLYYICLDYVNTGLQDSIDSAGSTKEKIHAWIFHMVCRFCDVPLMVKYIIQFYRQPNLFTEEVKNRYLEAYPPLVSLCKEAISAGLTKTSDPVLMEAMLLSPVLRLFDIYKGHENQFDPNTYTECIRLSVDSVMF